MLKSIPQQFFRIAFSLTLKQTFDHLISEGFLTLLKTPFSERAAYPVALGDTGASVNKVFGGLCWKFDEGYEQVILENDDELIHLFHLGFTFSISTSSN